MFSFSQTNRTSLEEYDTVPLFVLDADSILGSMTMTYCIVFEGELDPQLLQSSLETLVTKKWRLLGARLARNPQSGELEYRIPRQFSKETPPFVFTSQVYGEESKRHVTLPTPTPQGISVQSDPIDYSFFGFDKKKTLSYYLSSPAPPILSIHCSIFTDITLIGITASHTFNDAKGLFEILRAWSQCLNEGVNAVPDIPLEHTPLSPLLNMENPVPLPGHQLLSRWQRIQFMSRMMWETIWNPKESVKFLYFPLYEIERMKSDAKKELGDSCQLTTNDVISAWIFKASFESHQATDRTPAAVGVLFDGRPRLPDLFKLPYLHNAVSVVTINPPLAVAEIKAMTHAQLALRLHDLVATYMKPDIVRQHFAWALRHMKESPFPVSHDSIPFFSVSWRNTGFTSLNFSGALVPKKELTDRVGAGRLSLIFHKILSPFPLRRNACMSCQDLEGGVWIDMGLDDVSWRHNVFTSLDASR